MVKFNKIGGHVACFISEAGKLEQKIWIQQMEHKIDHKYETNIYSQRR